MNLTNWSFKKVTATILFGAIIFVFAMFGVENREMGDLGGSAAIVEGTPISIAQFRERMNQLEMQYKWMAEMGGEEGRKRFAQQLRFEAMRSLVEEEVLSQAAKKEGVLVSDAELSEQILNLPFLQENGGFKRERYDQFLKYRNMRADDFETEIRKSSARAKLLGLVQSAFWPTPAETAQFMKDREYQYKIRFMDVSSLTADKDAGSKDAVKAAVENKNIGAIDKLAKAKNLKWEEVAPFDLTQGVPRLGRADTLMNYLSVNSSNGLVPFVVEDGVRQFVVDVKGREKSKIFERKDNLAVAQQVSSEKLQSNLGTWLEHETKQSRIQQNNRLLQ